MKADGLSKYSMKQLEEELRKRELVNDMPRKLRDINWQPVVDVCEEYINVLATEGYEMKDGDYRIAEATLKSVFGDDVYLWINDALP